MKKKFFIAIGVLLAVNLHCESLLDRLKIGGGLSEKLQSEKITCMKSLLFQEEYELKMLSYNFSNYEGYNYSVYVDDRKIVRAIVVHSDNYFFEKITYKTKEGYTVYSTPIDIDVDDIVAVAAVPFFGKVFILKSGWGLLFYGADYYTPLDTHCSLVKLDVNYFELAYATKSLGYESKKNIESTN